VTSLFHKEKISKPECRIYLHRRSRLRTTDGKEYFVLRFFRAISLFSFLLVSLCGFGSPARSSQTVVDDLGRRIVLPHGAQRIVTLTPSATEILYAVGAGSKVVGVDNYSNYPASVARVTKLDGLNPSREVLASLRPDLIVISDQTMTAICDKRIELHRRRAGYREDGSRFRQRRAGGKSDSFDAVDSFIRSEKDCGPPQAKRLRRDMDQTPYDCGRLVVY
jgi:hypothetical protein